MLPIPFMHIPTDTAPASNSGFAGPWFMSPRFEEELEARQLSPELEETVRNFAENGYLVVDDLGLTDFDALAERVTTSLGVIHEGGTYNRIADAWEENEDVLAVATAPKILELLDLIYGRRPIPFQTLNFWKGSQQKTHSDAVHFHSFPQHLMCGVWVAFEDTDDRNGALHYYPGTHMLPVVEYADLGLAAGKDFYGHYSSFVDELIEGRNLKKEVPFLKRGQAIIWAANLLHGGDTINDPDSTRVSQVTHYYFDGCSYYTPVRSDFATGKIFFRQIMDLTTGSSTRPRLMDGECRCHRCHERSPCSGQSRAGSAAAWFAATPSDPAACHGADPESDASR